MFDMETQLKSLFFKKLITLSFWWIVLCDLNSGAAVTHISCKSFLLNVITRRFHRFAQHPAQTFPSFVAFSSIGKKGFLLPKICWQEHKPGKAPDNPLTQFPLELHFFSFGLHLQPKSMHISVSYHVM